jgi:hypothetical protein
MNTMLKKRGQATIFIVIGLILLLSMGVFLYYSARTVDEITPIPDDIDQASFTSYVESCLDATMNEVLSTIAMQGGLYEPTYYRTYLGTNIAFWCYGEDENQCVNALITKDDVAEQIIYGLRNEINTCLDFTAFKLQGYEIEEGTLEGIAIIAPQSIDLTISYPIKLKKGQQEITVEDFHIATSTPLGYLITITQYIINEEATAGQFDTVSWLKDHTNINIKKDKPYPGIIYRIQETSTEQEFQFAVKGIDTVSNAGETLIGIQDTNYGCCYIDNACYANTPSTVCETKAGTYETAPCTCEQPSTLQDNTQTECEDGSCNDCGSYKHGESRCEYDSSPGSGQDAPGSRHYVYSCFDGETVLEPCRDYREEICVQADTGSTTRAVCRANRWQDCAACTTEECCKNTEARDCYWNKDLTEVTTQCTPTVPPGIKFWEFNGIEICARANQELTCKGLHCDQEWVDATAISCFSQSDCGNDENIVEEFTDAGFLNSDLKFDPDKEVYDTPSSKPITNLPLIIKKQEQLLDSPVQEATDIFLHMVTAAYRFVNQWVDITIPNYLNPFTPSPDIEIIDVSICMPWQAPNTNNYCELCSDDESDNPKPCTEYRCKSLGKKCVYEEQDGFPTCTALPKEKEKTFAIEIDTEVMSATYVIEEETLAIEDTSYDGYKITPALKPYKAFTLGIKTTEQAICRLDYTPQAEYFDPPVFMIGSASFEKHHNITMRVPPQVTIPTKLKDTLNLTTAGEIVNALTEPKDLLENYEEKFPAVFTVYNTVTGDDLEDELEPYIDELLDLIDEVESSYPYYENLSITLLDKFDTGGYYLFVSCEDKFGNTQEEELFIEIDIAEETEDNEAPTILKIDPENNGYIGENQGISTIYLYTDEPATCRYTYDTLPYDEMEYSFNCNNEPYDIVAVAGGSYECKTTIETIDHTTVYIACADNPRMQQTYKLTLQGSNTAGVVDALYSESIPEDSENPIEEYAEYINVNTNKEEKTTDIFVSSYLLSDSDATIFNTTTQNTTVHLFIDEVSTCTLANATTVYDMNCTTTALEEQALGLYDCSAEITMDSLLTVSESSEETEETNTTNTTDTTDTSNSTITEVWATEELEINCVQADNINYNEDPIVYTLLKSEGLEIMSVSPGNNEETEKDTALTVTTSSTAEMMCGYAKQGSIEFLQMTQTPEMLFMAKLYDLQEGYNPYTIYCRDTIGNTAEETVSFYVIS